MYRRHIKVSPQKQVLYSFRCWVKICGSLPRRNHGVNMMILDMIVVWFSRSFLQTCVNGAHRKVEGNFAFQKVQDAILLQQEK